jgi:DNA-directed RNA polymerase subunit M/transcription elongation factor TFIIS
MSETIQFTCPACDAALMVAASLRGTKVNCPKCNNIAVISAPPADFVVTQRIATESASRRGKLVASIANYGHHSRPEVGFRCPFCQSNLAPEVKRKISTAGWVTFCALLFLCFPLSIIGLFLKDQYRVCRSCGIRLD